MDDRGASSPPRDKEEGKNKNEYINVKKENIVVIGSDSDYSHFRSAAAATTRASRGSGRIK
jgi:hypothetical protein